MGIGHLYVHYLYPGESKAFLTQRNEQLWEHYHAKQSEEMEYVFDEYSGGTLSLMADPIGGSIEPFSADDPPEIERGPDYPRLELSIDADQQIRFPVELEGKETEKYVSEAVSVIREIYELLEPKPTLVYGLPGNYHETIVVNGFDHPVSDESLAENRIEYIPWLVILPPAIVDTYGRETVLSAPAWQVEELTDGAILLVAYSDLVHGKDLDTAPSNHHLGLPDPWEDLRHQ